MKRFPLLAALLVCILVISLVTCGKDSTTQPTTQPIPLQADSELARMLQTSNANQPLEQQPAPPAVDATSGMAAIKPKTPTTPLKPEGIYILNRLARLGPKQDGFQELVFDSDGAALQDPPMRILPNQILAALEYQEKNNSDPVAFRISGMVTVYKDHNYILLEKAVTEPRK